MNRIIKFRAWDEETKHMFTHEDAVKDGWKYSEIHTPIDGFIMLQFTGLLDKNGKEIYEGDLMEGMYGEQGSQNDSKLERVVMKVVWERGGFRLLHPFTSRQDLFDMNQKGDIYWRVGGHNMVPDFYYRIDGLEIIGNIYETPELLTNT